MDLAAQKEYFEKVATNNNAIGHRPDSKHFTVFTVEDALTGFKSKLASPVLTLQLPEIRFSDLLSDNERENDSIALLIVSKVGKNDGPSAIIDAYLSNNVIALQVVSKMRNDAKKALQGTASYPDNLIKDLDLNLVSMVEVGPVFENHYGWRIEVQINGPVNLDFDESKWTNESAWAF